MGGSGITVFHGPVPSRREGGDGAGPNAHSGMYQSGLCALGALTKADDPHPSASSHWRNRDVVL